jgi:hypothetical protein
MPTHRFHFLALPIAIGSIALASCAGGDSSNDSGNTRADAREAALRFARCMREHGIDMPDPTFGPGGSVAIRIDGGAGKLAVNRAEEACRKYREAARGPEPSPEQQREFRENALKFARCMRGQGIDMADPTFDRGGVGMRISGGAGPDSPRFQAAQSKCAKYEPKAALSRSAGK